MARIRKIPIAGDFYDPDISYVLYLDGAPPRFVIFSEPRLYRLDASGRVQELASSKSFSVWRDKILLFEPSGMNLYRAGEDWTLLHAMAGELQKKPAPDQRLRIPRRGLPCRPGLLLAGHGTAKGKPLGR